MSRFVASGILTVICGIAVAQQPVELPPPTSTGVVVPERTVTLAAKLRANLSAAEARLRVEELNWAPQEKLAERIRSLRKQATVSAENLDDANFKVAAAEQAVASARAEVARARAMLDETKIRAPFDGVIIRKDVETGDVSGQATADPRGSYDITISNGCQGAGYRAYRERPGYYRNDRRPERPGIGRHHCPNYPLR